MTMKKYAFLFLTFFGLISCSKDNVDEIINKPQNQSDNFNFIYTVLLKSSRTDSVYKQEYLIENGKVITEKYTNYNNPEYNHLSTFEYDNNNRVIEEIQNNQTFNEITWDNNTAKVFNKNKNLIGVFQFNNSNQLTSYNDGRIIRFMNYDSNGNVISVETEAGIGIEYLDYDTTNTYPLSLINSISVLRVDYKPYFKNVFKTEKDYPFVGDDYSVPLTYYEYSWTLNSNGLIDEMTDEKTLIYISKFDYKK